MRIAVAYIGQETDTFNPELTELDAFEARGLYRGQEVLDKQEGFGQVGGFMQAVRDSGRDVEMVPLIKAGAGASGRLSAQVLETLTTELLEHLRAAGPLDGFAFLMHGACSAVGVDDVEGYLLAKVREVVGDLPIVVGLDHHANITQRMVDLSTAIIGHRTQPHDPFDTGRLVGELILPLVAGEVTPTTAWRKLRLISHQEQYLTSQGPMQVWFDRAREIEATDERVLSVSNFPMQPWLDVEEGGWATIVITDGEPEVADRYAEELADLAWSLRAEFQVTTSVAPAEAVAQAAAAGRLVILSDTGDSVFGGAGGDSTVLLAELLRAGAPRALVPLVDRAAARELATAGVGATVELDVGGTVTGWFRPVRVRATVRAVEDLVLRLGQRYREPEIDMGTTVVAEVDNVTLVISERPGIAGNHPGLYEHFGLVPADFGAAVLKTASNFQWFAELTDQVIRVNSTGPTQSDIRALEWRRVPRPIYPVDEVAHWR